MAPLYDMCPAPVRSVIVASCGLPVHIRPAAHPRQQLLFRAMTVTGCKLLWAALNTGTLLIRGAGCVRRLKCLQLQSSVRLHASAMHSK